MLFNYTDTLQNIFESYPVNHDETLTNNQVIENARPLLFDFQYPIFDESYKNVFETHFIRNFYIRQIGFDSYGLFKFQLETWLNIHMPYFNKLFESELLNYDPLTNFKINETDKRSIERKQDDIKSGNKSRNTEVEATVNRDQSIVSGVTGTGLTDSETDSTLITGVTANSQNAISGESKVIGSSDSSKNGSANGTLSQNNFNRQLETDTPQNRIAITTQDGTGVIEYASKIKENTDKNNQTSSQSNIEEGNESSTVDSTNSETDTLTSTSETTGTTNDKTKVTTSSNENTTTDDETNTTSNENSVQTENQSDTLNSNIKTIDDYISSKTGKLGGQSYAALVMDYRNALMRIERDIFKEMNQLFMLVY